MRSCERIERRLVEMEFLYSFTETGIYQLQIPTRIPIPYSETLDTLEIFYPLPNSIKLAIKYSF